MTQDQIINLIKQMLGMSAQTGKIFFLTLLFSLPLGLILSLGRMSKLKVINWPIRLYLLIMRGTPLILQLFAIFYGLTKLFGIQMERFTAAILAMSLNYAAYFAEIYRSGLESMPKGQKEAAIVLGFTKRQTFFKITLPQVIKRILPPMSSEFMTLVKDTALVSVIGVEELYQMATERMTTLVSMVPILIAGLFYLVMNSIVARGFYIAEKKLGYYQ